MFGRGRLGLQIRMGLMLQKKPGVVESLAGWVKIII
jgi:hypothetical protein